MRRTSVSADLSLIILAVEMKRCPCNYIMNTVTPVWPWIPGLQGEQKYKYKFYQLVLLKGYSWKVFGVKHYSCSKYFVYNLCENRCKIYTFHLMDSDYEEEQNYFSHSSLYFVATLSFSVCWWPSSVMFTPGWYQNVIDDHQHREYDFHLSNGSFTFLSRYQERPSLSQSPVDRTRAKSFSTSPSMMDQTLVLMLCWMLSRQQGENLSRKLGSKD